MADEAENGFDDDPTPAEVVKPLALGQKVPTSLTNAQRIAMFGEFQWYAEPLPGNPEHVRITGTWPYNNLVTVPLPLTGSIRHARVHRLIAQQFIELWDAWARYDLLMLILTVDGFYEPRYKRGRARAADGGPAGQEALSNHCWGSAMDLNYPWNKLGEPGAALGQTGSTVALEELAFKHGFICGRHFHAPYQDANHIEAFKICG